MKRILVLSLLVLAAGLYGGCTEAEAVVKVGAPAPDFTLTDTNGTQFPLSRAKGKFVVLEWLNHDCPFVRKHYDSGNMQKLQKDITAKGVLWYSVNSSAEGKQGHFKQDQANELTRTKGAAPTAVLLDWDGRVGRLYGARTTPHMYIIDPQGKLVYQGAIDDKPSTDREDVPGAKNYVVQALNEAMAGKAVSEASTKAYGCSVKY